MTSTPPEAPASPPPQDPTGDTGPRVDRDQVRDLGRLRRSRFDRKVAGVAGGLGRHLDVDPLILRIAFVVLVFFGGAGLIVYGACWLLVPEDGADKAPFNLDERSRSFALIIVGALAALALVGDSWGAFWFPWPVAIVALIALWLLTRNNRTSDVGASAAPPYPTPPQAYGAPPVPADPYAASPGTAPTYYAPLPMQPIAPPPYKTPNPRRRGPILFWFTLALIALAEGLLGIVDLAGAQIAGSAYPALAVGICGVMLLVGAFFGRAGGIILIGLIATVALTAATAADRWEGETLSPTPTTAAAVDDTYQIDAGEIVLDLRDVSDVDALAGRVIEMDADVGHLEVILPRGLSASVNADVDGFGSIELFGQQHGGFGVTQSDYSGLDDNPEVIINAQLSVGQIEVHR